MEDEDAATRGEDCCGDDGESGLGEDGCCAASEEVEEEEEE